MSKDIADDITPEARRNLKAYADAAPEQTDIDAMNTPSPQDSVDTILDRHHRTDDMFDCVWFDDKTTCNCFIAGLKLEVKHQRDAAIRNVLVGLDGKSIKAERASYLPKDHDGTTNWPIITEPVYIIPQSEIQKRLNDE